MGSRHLVVRLIADVLSIALSKKESTRSVEVLHRIKHLYQVGDQIFHLERVNSSSVVMSLHPIRCKSGYQHLSSPHAAYQANFASDTFGGVSRACLR